MSNLRARSGVGYVLVQGFVVAHARELDDLTRDKTDARDATLIADLAAELRFTETRLSEGPWAELDLLVSARDARRLERAAALPEMRRYKYDMSLATGSIAAGGTLGILIPPSVPMVIYAVLTEQSIGKLLIAGIFPGLAPSASSVTAPGTQAIQ